MPESSRAHVATGAFGLVAVAGNIVAVGALRDIPHAYKIEQLDAWLRESLAAPAAAELSAWAFIVGVGAMVPFLLGVADRVDHGLARAGARLATVGALLNTAGCVLPFVVVRHVPDSVVLAHALLATAVDLDAAFNLFLGAGLVLLGGGAWAARRGPRWLSLLGMAAGVLSLPVTLQAWSDAFARWLIVSGPLWLFWMAATSVWCAASRGDAPENAPPA